VPLLTETRDAVRVLIADDQPDVLEALRLLLSQHGFTLRLVGSPQALVEALASDAWDLLLIDLNYSRDTTSGAEGLELLTRIRARDPLVPIVVMTAWGNIDLAVEAMRRGAQSFVQKPWDNASLVQVLQREVDAGRGAREQSEQHTREQRDGLLIQRALMPAALPQTPRFAVAGAWRPAGNLGGDCYDAFVFNATTIGLSIADVAGKGLPAALIMSSLQASVRAFALEATPPGTICESVNRLLCGQMIAGRFATLCYLRLDAARGIISYANAGHNPPLVARSNGHIARLHAGGTVLGVFPEASYSGDEVPLAPGDRLLLYTDGITEARRADDEEYGESRLTDALLRHRHLGADALHAALLSDVAAFTENRFQDDATLLAVAVK
jgi:sigma-B regulation protein RsbU (phosphoserine phosphatase)